MKKDYIGFGYNPVESGNHFYVDIEDDKQGDVLIYERFKWDDADAQKIHGKDILKQSIKDGMNIATGNPHRASTGSRFIYEILSKLLENKIR